MKQFFLGLVLVLSNRAEAQSGGGLFMPSYQSFVLTASSWRSLTTSHSGLELRQCNLSYKVLRKNQARSNYESQHRFLLADVVIPPEQVTNEADCEFQRVLAAKYACDTAHDAIEVNIQAYDVSYMILSTYTNESGGRQLLGSSNLGSKSYQCRNIYGNPHPDGPFSPIDSIVLQYNQMTELQKIYAIFYGNLFALRNMNMLMGYQGRIDLLDILTREKETLNRELERARQENANVLRALRERDNTIAQQEAALEQSQNALAQSQSDLAQTQAALAQSQATLAESQAALNSANGRIASLESNASRYRSTIAQLESDNRHIQAKFNKLLADSRSDKSKIVELTTENQTLKATVERLRAAILELERLFRLRR